MGPENFSQCLSATAAPSICENGPWLLGGFEERESGSSERIMGSQTGVDRFEFDQPSANLTALFARKEGKFLEDCLKAH